MDMSQIDWKVLLLGLQPVLMFALNWVQDHLGEWKMPRLLKWALSFAIAQLLAWIAGLGPDVGVGVGVASVLSYTDGRRK